ncbi:MAG: hypothetical protein SFV19_06560 [Rhodospirillaceae bacterium]|nr:hypothetical protein [Rhodospirillaceae bacterium]
MTSIASFTTADIANAFKQRKLKVYGQPQPKLDQPIQKETDFWARLKEHNAKFDAYVAKLLADVLDLTEAGDSSDLGVAALFYWDGWPPVMPRDPCKGLSFAFRASAVAPSTGAPILAEAYFSGDGLPQDRRRAFFWAKEIWRQGGYAGWGKATERKIMSSFTAPERTKLEAEWVNWNPGDDVREQRLLECRPSSRSESAK